MQYSPPFSSVVINESRGSGCEWVQSQLKHVMFSVRVDLRRTFQRWHTPNSLSVGIMASTHVRYTSGYHDIHGWRSLI